MSEDMEWGYSREERKFELPPEGDYRLRIKSAEKNISSTGKDMVVLQFEVSGSSAIVYHNIVFLPDRPEITNRSLTQFFDSFAGIPEGQFKLSTWTGQIGAARLKHDTYNDKEKLAVHYFIPKVRQDQLPPWVEPSKRDDNSNSSGGVYNPYSGDKSGFQEITSDDDIPF